MHRCKSVCLKGKENRTLGPHQMNFYKGMPPFEDLFSAIPRVYVCTRDEDSSPVVTSESILASPSQSNVTSYASTFLWSFESMLISPDSEMEWREEGND